MIFAYDPTLLLLIALAGLYAGTQNTLAGGGSFITFPTLLLAGLDPLSANITSTLALFPNQITSSLAGRKLAGGVGRLDLKKLFVLRSQVVYSALCYCLIHPSLSLPN